STLPAQERQQPPLIARGAHPGRTIGTRQLDAAQWDARASAGRAVEEAQNLDRMRSGQHRQHGQQPGVYQAGNDIWLGFWRHRDLAVAQEDVTVVLAVFKILGESCPVSGCAVWRHEADVDS